MFSELITGKKELKPDPIAPGSGVDLEFETDGKLNRYKDSEQVDFPQSAQEMHDGRLYCILMYCSSGPFKWPDSYTHFIQLEIRDANQY